MEKIRNYSMEEFVDFITNEFRDINDLQLLILKGHVLVEYTINCYLEGLSKNDESNFFKEGFSFKNKIKMICHFSDIGSMKNGLGKELTLLNKLRNDIAHSLTYKEKHLTDLIAEISKKSTEVFYEEKNSNEKDKIIYVICFLTGAIFSGYKLLLQKDKEVDDFMKNKNIAQQ
jgi:hypothetical protein